jgi:protein-tyrosine phosphatase
LIQVQILKQKLHEAKTSGIKVSSAGVYALVGEPMPDEARIALDLSGYQTSKHSARQITPELAANADLILTATEDHRAEVIRTLTRANRYTFTLKEFANLAGYLADPNREEQFEPQTHLIERVRVIASARGYAPSLDDADIADPYGKPLTAYVRTQLELEPLLDAVVRWVGADG